MTDVKPHCKCQLDCSHHRKNPSGRCEQPATNWDGDHLCADCHNERVRHLKDELIRIDKEIEKCEAAHALMFKTGKGGEKELDKKTLDDLKAKRKKIARELEEAEQAST